MTIKNKILHLDSQFTKELPSADEAIDSIYISGYASVNVPDRQGDVVPSYVWERGIEQYLKNPVILAYHDHDDPCGRMVEHKIDEKGLWIKARISAAAEIFNLVKDGVLTAFSVGFRVKDATYDTTTDLFVVTELELLEISIVSVPANQDTLFSLSKSFNDYEDYKLFKQQFVKESDKTKGLESDSASKSANKKEIGMDPKELQAMLEKAASDAAQKAVLVAEQARQKAAEEAAQKAAADAELQKRIQEAVAAATPSTTGAERLVAELEKRIVEQEQNATKALEDLRGALAEKAAEIEAMNRSKMSFKDGGKQDEISYAEKEKAVLLSKISGKSIEQTNYGKELVIKALGAGAATGAHLPSQTWEHEVSLNMETEMRRRLIAEPLMRRVAMRTNVMSFPVNPEAGLGTWVTNAQFGTSDSSGATGTHQLKEVTLNSYKLATREYLAFEEEEDSLIAILPIVRDAMLRRTARSVDRAILLGAANGTTDPIKGLAKYDDVSAVTKSVAGAGDAGKFLTSDLRLLRKDLGAWGLDPSEVIYIVNTEAYYDLMDDALFQTMDKVGDRATVLTGMVGMVGGSPVLVSAELPARTSGVNTGGNVANVGAIAFNAGNFLVGNQRGIRVDTDDIVAEQRRVLVASLRMGMTQISTVNGQAVSAFRWLT